MTPLVQILSPEAPDWRAGQATLDLPEELEGSLARSPEARRAFADWCPLQQWDVAWFIQEAPDPGARRRRAEKAIGVLERRLAMLGA